jgi:hypothetical protein
MPVTGIDALHRLMTADRAGTPTALTILRLTNKLSLPVTPAERPDTP